jgi:hypothetical protein
MHHNDTLASWAASQRKMRPHRFAVEETGLQFAFYGRM